MSTPNNLKVIRPQKSNRKKEKKIGKVNRSFYRPYVSRAEAAGAIAPVRMGGNVQSFVERGFFKSGMTITQADWASGFLNINHADNIQKMPPMPDLFSKSTFMDKSISTFQIVVPSGYTGFDLILAPFYNVIALIRFNSANTGLQQFWYALEDPNKIIHGTDDEVFTSAAYAKKTKMYGNRVVARGLTMVNQTNQFNIGGDIKMVKLENSVDVASIPVNYTVDGEGYPAAEQTWSCLQRVPLSDSDMSNVVGGYIQQTAREGAYAIAKVSDLSWKNRQHVWDKVHPWFADNTLAKKPVVDIYPAANGLDVSDCRGNVLPVYFPDPTDAYGDFNGIIRPECDHVFPAIIDPRIMGLDTTFIRVAGLNTGAADGSSTFSLRINSVSECALHADSPYIKQKSMRPLPDVADDAFVRSAMLYMSLQTAMYPASFNFWDKVWSGFKKAWNWLAPVRKVLPSMLGPGAGSIAGTADSLISQLVAPH